MSPLFVCFCWYCAHHFIKSLSHLKYFRGGTSPASSALMSSVSAIKLFFSAQTYFLKVPNLISQKCQKIMSLKCQRLFLRTAKNYFLSVPKIIFRSVKTYFLKVPKLISLKCSLGCEKGALMLIIFRPTRVWSGGCQVWGGGGRPCADAGGWTDCTNQPHHHNHDHHHHNHHHSHRHHQQHNNHHSHHHHCQEDNFRLRLMATLMCGAILGSEPSNRTVALRYKIQNWKLTLQYFHSIIFLLEDTRILVVK